MAVTRRFADIDLSRLPDLPEGPDFDAIYAARLADAKDRLNAAGIPYDVGAIVGDTVAITNRVGAYRELLVYAAIDDAVRSVLLATATGIFLDQLGAGQVPPIERNMLMAATATTPALMELDDDFRARIQLGPESLSTCGPEGAYLSFALEVDTVKAAACYGPMSFGGTPAVPFVPPGEVRVPIVSIEGDGSASADLVAEVAAQLSSAKRRPIADWVTVSAAEIVPYRVEVVLYVGAGADRDVIRVAAEKRLAAQARRQHRPGAAQLRQMLYGAAYVPDASGAIIVEQVDLIAPAGDVNATPIAPATPAAAYRAPYCTEILVRTAVADG
jgi:phage-related baseplate assembly protein